MPRQAPHTSRPSAAAVRAVAVALLSLHVAGHAPLARAQAAAPNTTAGAPAQPAADAAETRALHALFARAWEWSAVEFPEWATYRGDLRFNHRLADQSPEARARRDRETAAFLAEARAIRRDRLSPADRISLDMFIDLQQGFVDQAAFPAWRGMTLRALSGPQTQFGELLQVMPAQRAEHVEQILARMAAFPRRMDQEIALVRESARAGWVPARDVLQRVLAQLDAQIGPAQADPRSAPHFAPFRRLGRDIPPEQQAALQQRGEQAIRSHVLPALQALRRVVADELLPKAPAEGGLRQYPGGEAAYALAVRQQTTTALMPQQIHDIGQRELARLRGEMEAVMRLTRFDGDFAAFIRHLYSDARFFHTSGDAMLAAYRDIAKRIDAEMPRLFAELPRAPYGIVAMPAHLGPNRAEYYNGPALDGSRAGFFYANVLALKSRPVWQMETLVAHEAAPGHHTQIARAAELRDLPPFRRSSFGYTAYTEGWALYAETLGFDLGLYTDPYARFGHLMWQAFRATRLVADTGIHALGWTRQQAIDFMVERTGVDRDFVAGEVDRYTSQPGQALAYMIGKLKIDELRDRARGRLGARFDIRRFHNAVLDNGALPLSVLERVVDDWIAAEAAR
jgi:uncharacterized protein (DUF885 family)